MQPQYIFGGMKINRKQKSEVIEDGVIRRAGGNSSSIINKKIEVDKSTEQRPPIPQQNPQENLVMEQFKSGIEIYRNGEKVVNNEYRDYNSELSPYYKNKSQNLHQTRNQPVRPTSEPVEQVDPASFFGNSMNGIVEKLKR